MAAFRFLSALFLLVAVVAFVSDLTPVLTAGSEFSATSLKTHWEGLAPASLTALKGIVTDGMGPWAWDNIIAVGIDQSTAVIFGFLALTAGYAGRRRHRINIFVN
jgi:hypothetical protein